MQVQLFEGNLQNLTYHQPANALSMPGWFTNDHLADSSRIIILIHTQADMPDNTAARFMNHSKFQPGTGDIILQLLFG
ncbi:hypothetical protein D3C73_1322070 [compost metagenome]